MLGPPYSSYGLGGQPYNILPPAHDYYMQGDFVPPPPPASYRPIPSSPETSGFHPLASTAGAGHAHGQYSMPQIDASASLSSAAYPWSPPYENTSTATAGPPVAQNPLAPAVPFPDPLSPAMHLNSSPPPTSLLPSVLSSPYAGQDLLSEWSDGAPSFAIDHDGQSVGSAYQSYARPIAKSEVATPAMRGAADRRRKKPHRFFCTVCPAGFTAKHNLQAHERSHIGKKGFACNKCGLAFDNPGVLKRHSDRCTGYAAR
uniref:C2H2-type domain-containing protein n=1 Tax=Schizophyllum commune (strain H4-8 / FGSC 9210) TaxID=578458 RepID=D8QI61_SCHCM